jgi:hypothetical protein
VPHKVGKKLGASVHCVTWVIGLPGLNTMNPKDSRNVKTQTFKLPFQSWSNVIQQRVDIQSNLEEL